MTLKDIEAMPEDFIGSKEIAEVCGMNRADVLRKAHEKDPLQRWPFPYTMNGNRLMVPKAAFLNWAQDRHADTTETLDLRVLAAAILSVIRQATQNSDGKEATDDQKSIRYPSDTTH